jgi:ubiquinone/menaquinone biosynthesis C-methylase UbiE
VSVGPEVFGEDYLHFYELVLTDEVSDRQAELIWRLLALRGGDEVLDVACGHGRIANRLAARGARMTGLDADPFFLERAREDAAARGVDVEYVEGDMRCLPWDARFDAVLLWFTAFGYFDDEGNATVLRELRRVLRNSGRAVLELNHLPWVVAHLQRQSFVRRGADVLLDDFVWHPETSVMEMNRIIVRGGTVRETPYSIRMFMPVELRDLLLDAGFERVELLGPEGEPLGSDDRRVIALACA